jgi:hypothetical protein
MADPGLVKIARPPCPKKCHGPMTLTGVISSPGGLGVRTFEYALCNRTEKFGIEMGSTWMNAVLSFLISAGIIAFGLWAITYSIAAGSPLGFTLMGILPVAIGSISLYGAICEAKLAQNVAPS